MDAPQHGEPGHVQPDAHHGVGRITWQPPATTSINDMRLFSERLTADWRKERIVEYTGYVITGGALVHWGPCLLHGRRGEE